MGTTKTTAEPLSKLSTPPTTAQTLTHTLVHVSRTGAREIHGFSHKFTHRRSRPIDFPTVVRGSRFVRCDFLPPTSRRRTHPRMKRTRLHGAAHKKREAQRTRSSTNPPSSNRIDEVDETGGRRKTRRKRRRPREKKKHPEEETAKKRAKKKNSDSRTSAHKRTHSSLKPLEKRTSCGRQLAGPLPNAGRRNARINLPPSQSTNLPH